MKGNERLELEKLAELRATLEASPLTQAILAEKVAKNLEARRAAAARIEALKKEQAEVVPRLQADLEAKEAAHLKAKNALDNANRELNAAKLALVRERQGFDAGITNETAVLIETSDPALDEADTWFADKLSWLRSPGRISRNKGGSELNIHTWRKKVFEESNEAAVLGAMRYCQSALAELTRMRLEPVADLEKIEQMKAAVPSIDVYAETTAEKNLGRGSVDPLHPLVKMAEVSATDLMVKKLLAKVDIHLTTPAQKLIKGRIEGRLQGYRPDTYERR